MSLQDQSAAVADTSPAPADCPFQAEHREVSQVLAEMLAAGHTDPREAPSGARLLQRSPSDQVRCLHAVLRQAAWVCGPAGATLAEREVTIKHKSGETHTNQRQFFREGCRALLDTLCGRKLPYTNADIRAALDVVVDGMEKQPDGRVLFDVFENPVSSVPSALLKHLEIETKNQPLAEELRPPLERLRTIFKENEWWAGYKRSVARVDQLLGAVPAGLPEPGRPWTDALIADTSAMPDSERTAWIALLEHARVANKNEPSAKWIPKTSKLLQAVGDDGFRSRLLEWFSLVGRAADAPFSDRTADLLKGLVWASSLLNDADVCRSVGNLAETCFSKLPVGGLLSSRVGLACIYTLSRTECIEGVAQLVRLKQRLKSPWGLEQVDKALAQVTDRLGKSPEEIEEGLVPDFGMTEPGVMRRAVGPCIAEIRFESANEVTWQWLTGDGRTQQTCPAKVQKEHADALKALKQTVADAQKMLKAQRDRLERLFLIERRWPLSVWHDRYLHHPLVSVAARRLIWGFEAEGRLTLGIWRGDGMVGVEGRPLDGLSDQVTVQLWRSMDSPPADVLRWRIWLEEQGVVQPFKQAHREVYVLTNVELETATYSNRFAAHVLRQHQLAALCRQRRWTYDFLGEWDSGASGAHLDLPEHSLRAEFVVNHVGDQYADSGVALYVSSDQLRFVSASGEPVALVDVPARVISEVMRDVDLFVSVASIGNDPAWLDSGETRDYDGYWTGYSLAELSLAATERRDLLERLVPRLKIRDRCELDNRFLRIRGDLRNYKIHLGSGNILMEPNDQYLCIVPDQGAKRSAREADLQLPFEGDALFSIILSKAILLANDSSITDPTIKAQIQGG